MKRKWNKVSTLFDVIYSVCSSPNHNVGTQIYPHSCPSLHTHILSTDSSSPILHDSKLKFNYVYHTLRERQFGFQIGLSFTKYVNSSSLFLKLDLHTSPFVTSKLNSYNITHIEFCSETFCHY